MIITVPDEFAGSAHLSEQDLRLALALALYEREQLSLGKAAELAEVSVPAFLDAMGERGISLNYDGHDVEDDLRNLQKLDAAA